MTTILTALRAARVFVSDELECRRRSFLPDTSEYVDSARSVLAGIEAGITAVPEFCDTVEELRRELAVSQAASDQYAYEQRRAEQAEAARDTEQTMHAAWRKRAEESEKQLAELQCQNAELLAGLKAVAAEDGNFHQQDTCVWCGDYAHSPESDCAWVVARALIAKYGGGSQAIKRVCDHGEQWPCNSSPTPHNKCDYTGMITPKTVLLEAKSK